MSGMLAVAVWLAVGGGGAAAIGQPERAARAGMAAYRGGDFETAASAFTGAAELRPGNAGLLYNAGAAAYRLGSYGAARRLLQASINGADDDRLAAAGHLAVGHSWMAEAEQLAQTDPAAVPAALEAAIKSYERTLRLNGDRVQAAYHLERARAMLDELRRQMAQDSTDSQDNGAQRQQQEQSRQQQEQQQEQQEQQEAESGQDPDQPQQGQQQQQGAPPQDAGEQDTGTQEEMAADLRSDEEADAVARQIIAAEEALAAMMERRRQEMEPVARDW
ncbi:MAG: hypothetical protein OXJ62_16965 [Spirochaetaceae bacterium]|nr:hypothetical protein [Spirochaetaceae bacterium]